MICQVFWGLLRPLVTVEFHKVPFNHAFGVHIEHKKDDFKVSTVL